jgi:hypothetical protein
VPQRTNLFQEVVEIIHRHMAGDASVEASAMLPNRRTGASMEVDTVVRTSTAGYEVVVSIEAIARSRKAGPGWVNEMVGKHEDLPTSKLVLVSEKDLRRPVANSRSQRVPCRLRLRTSMGRMDIKRSSAACDRCGQSTLRLRWNR